MQLLDGGVRGSDYVGDVTTGTLFSASFYSAEAKIDGFLISGNLGADGGGSFESFHLDGPRGSHAYYKQVYGAQTDPSISHLIITRAPPDQLVSTPTLAYNTDSDYHEVLFNTGQQVVMYMLWAGKLPSSIPGYDYAVSYRYTRQQVQVILDAVAGSCFMALPPAVQPPKPPPPPPVVYTPDCNLPVGSQTCAAFINSPCATVLSLKGVNCGTCCSSDPLRLLPPPPPAIQPPPPGPPSSGACGVSCAGATCGAFQPYSCDSFQSVLGCDCSGCCVSPLDARCIDHTSSGDQVWPANLPALYIFEGGVIGYYIEDGGRDAFDIGNELRIRVNGKWSSPLYYNQICDGSHSHPVGNSIASLGDAQYITCKLPLSSLSYYSPGFGAAFILIGSSKAGMIDGFMTLGNLGADKGGAQKFNDGNSPLRGPHGIFGYYKKTYGADDAGVDLSDPSINHLIFGKGLDKAEVTIGSSTDSDLHELHFKNGVTQFYYILFMGKEGYSYSEAAFQEVLNALANSCNLEEARLLPGGADEPPGVSGWLIAAIVILVWFLLCFLAGCFWAKRNGKLDAIMDKLPAIPLPAMRRAKTTPARRSAPSTSMAPLSTAKISLTTADSAAEEFATSYQPPSQ